VSIKTCLRCDWRGEATEPSCPSCGERPLYVTRDTPASNVAAPPGSRGPAGVATLTPSATPAPAASVTASPRSSHDPTLTHPALHEREPSVRSTRSGALVLAAVLLALTGITWLTVHHREATPTRASSMGTPSTEDPIWRSPSSAPQGVVGIEDASIGKHVMSAAGVRFSLMVPADGWARFGTISLNKSIRGSQGAEGIIFWSGFPNGGRADPCATVLSPTVGPSAADLAEKVSAAPGTELVSGPSNVTLGGRRAKHVVVAVREDLGCDPGYFYTWDDIDAGPLWPSTDAGYTIRVWIIRVHGQRLFIEAETTEQANRKLRREIHQIVGSMRFD
jgi:hypothetical protein